MKKYKTLKEFYPYYLSEHGDKYTKLFHFIGVLKINKWNNKNETEFHLVDIITK